MDSKLMSALKENRFQVSKPNVLLLYLQTFTKTLLLLNTVRDRKHCFLGAE